MRLSSFIAGRYLFAKKSHNVINIISLISAIGIAVGSCALVIVLSVYNGFEGIVRGMYDAGAPDIVVERRDGALFSYDDSLRRRINECEGIRSVAATIEENVFLHYDREEGVALLKGVDSVYASEPSVRQAVKEGSFTLWFGDIAQAVVGRGLYSQMGIRPGFVDPIEVYYPVRGRDISMVNPMSSLNREIFFPKGLYVSGDAKYENVLFVPIEKGRLLLGIGEDRAEALEIRLAEGADARKAISRLEALLGGDYLLKDKYMQNELVYRMMRIEKVVIFMILLFIIVIVSCNVYGSLTMLIIEKRDDILTLKHLGARETLIRAIFYREGWLIIFWGTLIGISIGTILSMIQQYVGVIPMPGNFVVKYYPVVIKVTDILITFAGVALIGSVITFLPVRHTLSKIVREQA